MAALFRSEVVACWIMRRLQRSRVVIYRARLLSLSEMQLESLEFLIILLIINNDVRRLLVSFEGSWMFVLPPSRQSTFNSLPRSRSRSYYDAMHPRAA